MSEGPTGTPGQPNGHGQTGFSAQFGQTLQPVLLQACRSRLDQLHWFRADWQRGGALTGYALWTDDQGRQLPAVVKMPVPPQELYWLDRLQAHHHDHGDLVPRLYASGTELGGYDLAWVVMERLPFGPLDNQWKGAEWDLLIDALGRFYAVAAQVPVHRPPRREDWPAILRRARQHLRQHELPQAQQWNTALKRLKKKLKALLAEWDGRDCSHWCHGDIHLANAMTRTPPPGGPALLFDFAEVHPGHWVEDAVYLEHLFWAHPQRLGRHDLVRMISLARKQYGLPLVAHWPRLADIRRALVAASAPAYPRTARDLLHLQAALLVLERTLDRLNL